MEQVVDTSDVIVRLQYATIRSYIYWSTLIGVFSGYLVIRVPIAITLFDGIMVTNLILMLLVGNIVRVPVRILGFILYLCISGGIGLAHGTDTIGLVTKEVLGVSVSLVYFYFFFKMIRDDFERAFLTYAEIAFWFAVIAIPIWAGSCIYLHEFVRVRGFTQEPTFFCELILPAYYYCTYHYLTSRLYGARVALFTVAVVLANSTNGYLAALLGAVLLLAGRGRLKYLIAVPVIVGGLATIAYTSSALVRLRVDDTLAALVTQDVSKSNLSTFALISNVIVTRQVLQESPILGNGLGSHPISHDRFLADIPGIGRFFEGGFEELNAAEAASLGLRTLSELGLLGLSIVLIFVFYCRVGGSGPRAAISSAILIVIFLKLIRDGHYFPPELFFFAFVYFLNHRQHKLKAQASHSRAPSKFRWCLSG